MTALFGALPGSQENQRDASASCKWASMLLEREGFVSRLSWEELKAGARPPPLLNADSGEWQHGWQCYASFRFRTPLRETVVLDRSCAGDQAHLRSHSGPGVGAVFHGSPTRPEFQVPLLLTEARCECAGHDIFEGTEPLVHPHSGRLKRRAHRERWPEARNVKLQDTNVQLSHPPWSTVGRGHYTPERSHFCRRVLVTESIPVRISKTISLCQKITRWRHAKPGPDGFVERVELCNLRQLADGFASLDDGPHAIVQTTRSRDEIHATSHQHGGSVQE